MEGWGDAWDLRGEGRWAEHTETGPEGEELVAADGGGEVGDGEEDVVAARLVEAEDVAVSVGGVVEGSDEVLERGAGVVCQLGEEDLGLFFCECAHLCGGVGASSVVGRMDVD